MACYYRNFTADTLIKEREGKLKGIFVAAASAVPTLKLWDSADASGAVLINTFTPVAATYYPMPDDGVQFTKGLFADIGGTVDITIFYE